MALRTATLMSLVALVAGGAGCLQKRVVARVPGDAMVQDGDASLGDVRDVVRTDVRDANTTDTSDVELPDVVLPDVQTCRADGINCYADFHCCSNFCGRNPTTLERVCQPNTARSPVCVNAGVVCANNIDCCAMRCMGPSGDAGQCETVYPVGLGGASCLYTGAECRMNSECCSEFCRLDPSGRFGWCEQAPTTGPRGFCLPSGWRCDLDAECCAGRCVSLTPGGELVCP